MRSLPTSIVVASSILLARCMVFDESMRRPRSSDGGTDGAAPAPSSSGEPVDPARCSVEAEPSVGAAGCGGAGGGLFPGNLEIEPNNQSAQSLTLGTVVCGTVIDDDVDQFSFTVDSDPCFVLLYQTAGAGLIVEGPD